MNKVICMVASNNFLLIHNCFSFVFLPLPVVGFESSKNCVLTHTHIQNSLKIIYATTKNFVLLTTSELVHSLHKNSSSAASWTSIKRVPNASW